MAAAHQLFTVHVHGGHGGGGGLRCCGRGISGERGEGAVRDDAGGGDGCRGDLGLGVVSVVGCKMGPALRGAVLAEAGGQV